MTKKQGPSSSLILVGFILPASLFGATSAPDPRVQEYLHVPLAFERQGQGPGERYVARGQGYTVGIDGTKAIIGVVSEQGEGKDVRRHAVSLEFAGAKRVAASPGPELPGKVNRILGKDPSKWEIGRSTYGKVVYSGIYPGIDVAYYGNQQQLEFDLVVKPGADPRAIRLKLRGAGKLSVDSSGALDLGEAAGGLRVALPRIYQDVNGTKKSVAGHFAIVGRDEVAFRVDRWDRRRALVIDPTIVYSAIFGGGLFSSGGYGIRVDGSGNIVIAGYTYAADFPTLNAAQNGFGGNNANDAFVSKINPAGTAFIYSTYLGGSNYDDARGLALDSSGSAWVAGYTQSPDFPLLNASQTAFGGIADAFVAKLSPAGALQFSTFLGGSSSDYASGIAVDSSDNAYVGGYSNGGVFPTTSGVVSPSSSGFTDVFITKFSPSGAVLYSTLLGGSSTDVAEAIAVDPAGNAYVTGYSYSSSFTGAPAGGAQTTNRGSGDVFVAKLNANGTALLYFTFLGGSGNDQGKAIAVDSSTGSAYIAGQTASAGLATAGAAQTTIGGASDGFIAKLNASGTAFNYVTYLGGSRNDYLTALAIDGSGNAYVSGYTESVNLPTASALQPALPGNGVSLFNSSSSGAVWSPFDANIPGAVTDISINPGSGSEVVLTDAGIYRSVNGGASWSQQSGVSFSSLSTSFLSRSPVAPATIYAASCCSSIYKSTDDGITWNFVGNALGQAKGLLADPLSASTLYAYTYTSPYVFKSTDGGSTWNSATTGLPGSPVNSMVATTDGAIYAGTNGAGIYKSVNQGGSWTAVNTGLSSASYVNYSQSLAASGTTLYFAGSTIYKSTDGGASWSATSAYVGTYSVAASAQNPSVLYAYTYNNFVQKSTDGGATWNAAGTGLPTTSYYYNSKLVVDPGNSAHVSVVAPVNTAAFAAKLNSAGSALTWSTYLGGSSTSYAYAMANDGTGNTLITGYTSGSAFPRTSSALPAGTYGAFLTKISDSTAACSTLSISPGNQTISPYGQTLTYSVVAPSGCNWTASLNQSWATITSGASGAGSSIVTVQVNYNSNSATQTAILTVGSQSVTITQPSSSCVFNPDQTTYAVPANGGTIPVTLTATSGCPWSITNNYSSAVSVAPASSGSGNAVLSLTVTPNRSPSARNFYLPVGTAQIQLVQPSNILTVTTTSVPGGAIGAYYATTLSASGGAPPYSNWTVATGSLPPGLTLNPTTGVISGIPSTRTGSPYAFSVTAKDSTNSVTSASSLSIAIGPFATSPGQSEALASPRMSGQLLFPFVTDFSGFDTELTISNTSLDTLGSAALSGTCTLSFYGTGAPSPGVNVALPGGALAAGSTRVVQLSSVAPAFQGYVIANCTFPLARGTARSVYNAGQPNSLILPSDAQVITLPRTVPSTTSFLLPFVTNQLGFDTGISIANTSSDPFGSSGATPTSGSCTLNFYGVGAPSPGTGVALPYGPIASGTSQAFTLSSVAAGFQGYIIGQCNFGAVAAYAYGIYGAGQPNGYAFADVPEVLALPRSASPQPLLFPAVTNQNGTETGIAIANTSSDPFGSVTASGACTLSFYGTNAPSSFTTPTIPAGTVYTATLSAMGATGFKGYVTAACPFGPARGFAFVLPPVTSNTYSVTPEVVSTPRNSAASSLLFSNVTAVNGYDTKIDISNTSLDTFGTVASAGSCKISYYGTVNGGSAPSPQTSVSIAAGSQLSFSLWQGNTSQGIAGAPGFRGYIIADCAFPQARGTAEITGAVVVGTSALPAGSVGTAYSQTLKAVNGFSPYSNWTVASGALPGGLTLNAATGVISGTPATTAGSPFSFGVSVQDAAGNVSGVRSLSIAIGSTSITGSVKWNGSPVPGATVQLKAAGDYSTQPVLASATAGSDGSFVIANAPAGSFTLYAVSPSSDYWSWSATSITVVAGQTNNAGTLTLSKILQLSSPANNATGVSLTPTLQWVAFSGATSYQVGVFDNSTGASVFTQTTTGTQATISPALTGGHNYQWSVYANNASGQIAYFSAWSFTTLAATTTTLTSASNPAAFGQPLYLTAAVLPATATGTVTFKDGGVTLGTATLSSGTASFTASAGALVAGSHVLTAVYGGDTTNPPSTSAALSQTVSVASSSIVAASSANPSLSGQSITLTAVVTPYAASGTVTFLDGSNVLGTATLNLGTAKLAVSGLSAGAHSFVANYSGDANDIGSASTSVAQMVLAPTIATTTTLASSSNPSKFGQSVTLTATVVPSGATGNVTFYDGTTVLGTSVVSGGKATLTTKLLPTGARSLKAWFAFGSTYSSSGSAVLSQVVGATPIASNGFLPAVTYPAGTFPEAVAVGDFNGDNKPDMVVANFSTSDVSVFLGNGDGTFGAAVSYAVGSNPFGVTIGDFNGDGKADLVVGNGNSNNLSVLLGNGDGTFQAAVNYSGAYDWVVTGDFNGDGITDLASLGAGGASVMLGKGDGTFFPQAIYPTGSGSFGISAGDFNGDGRVDLAVSNNGDNDVTILLGNGDGTFRTAGRFATGGRPRDVTVGDFNGDGKADLGIANNLDNTVSVLTGNGDGTFQTAANYPLATAFGWHVVAGDVNSDGKTDLVAGSSVLLGNGDGTFQSVVNYSTLGYQASALSDLNGDGVPDIAVAGSGATVLLGKPSVSPYTITALTPNSAPAGGGDVALSIAGSNLASATRVAWTRPGGTTVLLAASFASAAQITASLPAYLMTTAGPVQIAVSDSTGTVISNQLPFTITSPYSITSLTPNTAAAGSGPVSLSIAGSNLSSASKVAWTSPGGTTTLLSPGTIAAAQMLATLPAALLTTAGTAQVAVSDATGAVFSNQLPFTIAGPSITSLTPNTVSAGSGPVALSIAGFNLTGATKVAWTRSGGATVLLSASFTSAAQITASLPAYLMTTAGAVQIAVSDAAGGVVSNQLPFTITAALPALTITTGSLNPATPGSFYSQALGASGGNGSYTWSASGLPSWLSLTSAGVLSGTPTTEVGPVFVVTVTSGSLVTSKTFTLSAATQTGTHNYRIDTIAGQLRPSGVPGTSTFLQAPQGLAFDGSGSLYIVEVDGAIVRKIDAANTSVSTVAGTGFLHRHTGSGGPALSASFNAVRYVAVDSSGNLFLTEWGSCVVDRVDAVTQVITVYAGTAGTCGFAGDGGLATSAQFSSNVRGIAVDSAGVLYIADSGNSRIRTVDPVTGIVATFAGNGDSYSGDNGQAAAAGLGSPVGIALDASGNLFVGASSRIRRIDRTSGIITTYAGTGSSTYNGEGVAATSANIGTPRGLGFDNSGNLYFADSANLRIRRVDAATRLVTTIGGNGTAGLSGDGGPGPSAQMTNCEGLAVDASGNVYFSDFSGGRVRKLTNNGGGVWTIGPFAGSNGPENVAPLAALTPYPLGVATDGNSNILISGGTDGRIRKVTSALTSLQTIAGAGYYGGDSGDGGPATGAVLNFPGQIARDAAGNIYIAESLTVRKIDVLGNISTVAGSYTSTTSATDGAVATSVQLIIGGIAVNSSGAVFFSDTLNHKVWGIAAGKLYTVAGTGTPGTSPNGTMATAAALNTPLGIRFDGAGNLLIADYGNALVRMIQSGGQILTVAGTGVLGYSGDGLPATMAQIRASDIAVAPNGDLFLAAGSEIRLVTHATGLIETVAGTGISGFGGDGGPARSAQIASGAINLDAAGRLLIADTDNNVIRRLSPTSSSVAITTASLPDGTVNNAYSATLAATGGSGGYANWTVVSGALPPGLTLDPATGIIGGIPSAGSSSPYTFSVAVRDSSNTFSLPANLSLRINSFAITSLNPTAVPVGSAGTRVTVTGSGLSTAGAVVFTSPGGVVTVLPPSLIAAAQVAATIPASLLTSAGTAQVALSDGSGVLSNRLPLQITPFTIASISPATIPAGSASTSVSIAGTGLGTAAKVAFTSPGGAVTLITPSLIAAAQVAATIPASLLTTSGTAQVALADGSGALSNQLPLTISSSAVTLSLGDGSGRPGQTVEIPLQMTSTGTPAATGFQADLSFDSTKLTYLSARAGDQTTSAGKSLSTNTLAGGDIRLLVAGLNQTAIANGIVAYAKFTVNSSFTSGSTVVTPKNCSSTNADGGALPTACTAGTIRTASCDINGDGTVNVSDVQLIINEALGLIPAADDLNGDGTVNVADVQKVINAALGLGCILP